MITISCNWKDFYLGYDRALDLGAALESQSIQNKKSFEDVYTHKQKAIAHQIQEYKKQMYDWETKDRAKRKTFEQTLQIWKVEFDQINQENEERTKAWNQQITEIHSKHLHSLEIWQRKCKEADIELSKKKMEWSNEYKKITQENQRKQKIMAK